VALAEKVTRHAHVICIKSQTVHCLNPADTCFIS
jgi:hypothetical protein